MVQNSRFFRTFGPPCRNPTPLAKVDGSMPECAQVCALHMRPHLATLRKTETADGWVAIGVSRKTGIKSLSFWLTLQYSVTGWSKHMRQLDRGEIKLFSVRCSYASIFTFLRYMDVKSRNGEKFELFGAPCRIALADLELTVLHQNVRRSVP